MKWGVRRTPEQLGHPTKQSNKDVNNILKSLSDEDLHKLNIEKGEKYNSSKVLYRAMKKVGNTPVSVFDIEYVNNYIVNATIITRGGDKYRGKGYASEVVKSGLDWWDKNKRRFDGQSVNWWVREGNIGSIKLAVNNGFGLVDDNGKYPGWKHYKL